MSLAIAVPCGIAAATAYGASTAVEHSAAHNDGEADARGLLALLRNPRWLIGFAGDGLGLLLQVAALATGPVVLIQPLLVLALPISLPIRWLLGGPRPSRRDYGWCVLIIAALGAFFAIVGNPGDADVLAARTALIMSAAMVAGGAVTVLAVRSRRPPLRALIYGGVAGVWSGGVGVLIDAAAAAWSSDGIDAVVHVEGLAVLAGLIVLGVLAVVLTQVALQVGELAASFPANLTADPVAAIALGAALLGEDLPSAPWQLAAYVICLGAIVLSAVRLARPEDEPADPERRADREPS